MSAQAQDNGPSTAIMTGSSNHIPNMPVESVSEVSTHTDNRKAWAAVEKKDDTTRSKVALDSVHQMEDAQKANAISFIEPVRPATPANQDIRVPRRTASATRQVSR